MHAIRTAPSNPFTQDAPQRPDLGPSPDPWVQAEIDRLRQRNALLADSLVERADELKAMRALLADLKQHGTTPVSEALALVTLDRGVCPQCWRSAIPACGCSRD